MRIAIIFTLLLTNVLLAQSPRPILTGSPLTGDDDLSVRMVAGIDRFLTRKGNVVRTSRESEWRNLTARGQQDWYSFLEEKRQILREIWGMRGERKTPSPWIESDPKTAKPYELAVGGIRIVPVKWEVLDGIEMAGLLLQPDKPIKANLVMIPDADQYPEELAGFEPRTLKPLLTAPALGLAQQGVQVLIPSLISRKQTYSGSELLNIYTNQPHREWIYRQAFNLGRHLIGYELLKASSCIDWFFQQNTSAPIAVAGYGEGGMLALYTAAIDSRVKLLLTSGFLGNTEAVWSEPIYRNLHGVLQHAGGAELLAMAAEHASVLVEYSESPTVPIPPLIDGRRGGAAPGQLITPSLPTLENEVNLARGYRNGPVSLLTAQGNPFSQPFAELTVAQIAQILKLNPERPVQPASPDRWTDVVLREKQQLNQLEVYTRHDLEVCERKRTEYFWNSIVHDPVKDQASKARLREEMHQTIGKITDPLLAASPKFRLIELNERWEQYEVTLEVWDDVFAWGILVIPNEARSGKRLPVVVCQHGLEGLPNDLITRDPADRKFKIYKAMGLELAERGYITFSPHNPYRGEDAFRVLQRKANPLGLSLFSVIVGQHQQIVNWLSGLPFVDRQKIGFYGLSYGGKSAMRIPALVEGYALSICSGDFNEWIRKVASTQLPYSYQFTKEYEIYEWSLANRFNYAEMAALIAPRPFMVEYGYRDGIGTAEWIGYEFGKVRKHYDLSGLSDKLDIDLFNGVHEIHGEKTYQFLDKHLKNTRK